MTSSNPSPNASFVAHRIEVKKADHALEISFIPANSLSLRPQSTALRSRLSLRAAKTLLTALEDGISVFFPTEGFSGSYIGFEPHRNGSTTVFLSEGDYRSRSGKVMTQVLKNHL